jgi:hypothetical protein
VLAVMPVMAQAVTQHWYQNSVLMSAGEEVPVVMFGNEENLNLQNNLGGPDCKAVGGGTIENPVGGGAGVGKTNSLADYECKAGKCEEEVLKTTGVPGRLTITTANNPGATKEPAFPGWTNLLEESTVEGVSSIREKIGEPFVTFKTPSPPGMIRETEECTVSSTGQVVAEAIVEGELKPEIGVAKTANLNGNSAGAPSQAKFNAAATGAMHSKLGGNETWKGNLKYLGYFHQEVITVKP